MPTWAPKALVDGYEAMSDAKGQNFRYYIGHRAAERLWPSIE